MKSEREHEQSSTKFESKNNQVRTIVTEFYWKEKEKLLKLNCLKSPISLRKYEDKNTKWLFSMLTEL